MPTNVAQPANVRPMAREAKGPPLGPDADGTGKSAGSRPRTFAGAVVQGFLKKSLDRIAARDIIEPNLINQIQSRP